MYKRQDLGVTDIYLIYYNGKLIGGTSPFTLVYTSPNWQRIKNITSACGLAGNPLFTDYSAANAVAVPLHKRHQAFQYLLTRYYVAFHGVANMGNTAFFNYIFRNQSIFSEEAKAEYDNITGNIPYTVGNFRNDYSCVQANMSEIDILGHGGADTLFLATKKTDPTPNQAVEISDDYKIDSSVGCEGDVPLVLSESGITGAYYVAGNPLPKDVVIIKDPDQPLDSRVLPGGQNIKYPYLTEADFLQEKLIKVGYKIDTDNFNTFGIVTDGDGDYLLPLRKEIFNYFSPSDFDDNNIKLSLRLEKNSNDEVTAHLFVPVQCKAHPYIELTHTYYKEDIQELRAYPDIFSIGVFPSYRVNNNAGIPNIYSVLILDQKKLLETGYYAISNGGVTLVEKKASKNRLSSGSRYEEINEAFDLCEVEVNEAKALLIPKFKEVTPAANGGNTVVGIDFGTTNTYICYSMNKGGDPQELEITRQDLQVLMLNKIDLSNGNYGSAYNNSMYMLGSYPAAIDREFVPLLLGKQSNVAYPLRTVTCETNDSQNGFSRQQDPMLFADINVGFNFLREFVQLPKDKYNTNIKWDIEQNNNDEPLAVKQNRVKAFCKQTAWMIKSKLMLVENPYTSFSVFLTFPYTMKRGTKNAIEKYWKEAFDAVMGVGNVTINRVTESIAPYYTMVSNDGNFTKNALNIDIGGGTTDMLFADINNNKFYYTSSKFAGNDIWGDGKHLVNHRRQDNGFVKDFEQKLGSKGLLVSDERSGAYQQYKALVESSADLMSYVFRYEDEFKYINEIRNSKNKFLPILCIHLGAILYHVAQVLTEKDIVIPSTITFSGMGAKYIRIISDNDDDIQDIVKKLLTVFISSMTKDGRCDIPDEFKVSFQTNAKEVTAQGAMLVNHRSLNEIGGYTEEALCVYGVDTMTDSELRSEDVPALKDDVLETYSRFLDTFVGNERVKRFFKQEFDIEFTETLIKTLKQSASQSFDLMLKDCTDGYVSETMFFWPLKNGLYEASK